MEVANRPTLSLEEIKLWESFTDSELLEQFKLCSREISKKAKSPKYTVFPENTPYSLEHYPKHVEFLDKTNTARMLLFQGANRVGKTWFACYCTYIWMTGKYPQRWKGRRWDRAVSVWAAALSHQQTMATLQIPLLGDPFRDLPGFFTADELHHVGKKGKPAGSVLTFSCKHYELNADGEYEHDGTYSSLVFKSDNEGREEFQGSRVDIIIKDEESALDILQECDRRVTSTNAMEDEPHGLVAVFSTPLLGYTQSMRHFLESSHEKVTYVRASIYDAPHIPQSEIKYAEEVIRPRSEAEFQMRCLAIPQMGVGSCFPVARPFWCKPIDPNILTGWLRYANGLDTGFNQTAAVFGAYDDTTDTVYIYGEKIFNKVTTGEKAYALARISRAPYVADTSIQYTDENTAVQYNELYYEAGLDIFFPNKKNKGKVYEDLYSRMTDGRIVIDPKCKGLIAAIELAHRDENGRIVKHNEDHPLDALQYLMDRMLQVALPGEEVEEATGQFIRDRQTEHNTGRWLT